MDSETVKCSECGKACADIGYDICPTCFNKKNKEARDEVRRERNRRFREKEAKEREEYKQKLFENLGIEDHPKRELLFQMAWDNGHSEGYGAVTDWAQDLAELLS